MNRAPITLHRGIFPNEASADARTQIMSFIDWYNHHRRHTRLDNLSPIRYEQHHQPAAQAA